MLIYLHSIDKTYGARSSTRFTYDKYNPYFITFSNESFNLKEYKIVMDMPGVGEILGPWIIAEIGDVRQFHSASALVAYAGLDAPPFQSGSFMAGKRSISNAFPGKSPYWLFAYSNHLLSFR